MKGSRYSVSSFKPVVLTPKNYIIHVTGMT
jgi:hypothetical protein